MSCLFTYRQLRPRYWRLSLNDNAENSSSGESSADHTIRDRDWIEFTFRRSRRRTKRKITRKKVLTTLKVTASAGVVTAICLASHIIQGRPAPATAGVSPTVRASHLHNGDNHGDHRTPAYAGTARTSVQHGHSGRHHHRPLPSRAIVRATEPAAGEIQHPVGPGTSSPMPWPNNPASHPVPTQPSTTQAPASTAPSSSPPTTPASPATSSPAPESAAILSGNLLTQLTNGLIRVADIIVPASQNGT